MRELPASVPPNVREIIALEAEVTRLRKRIGAVYPLEEREIWDRACVIHREHGLTLADAVEEALMEFRQAAEAK